MMKQVTLKSVSLRGFRSFKEDTVVSLPTPAGLKLVTGENKAEPRLGANGAGKSTLWDAVCFALYGTSIKGLRAADLVTRGEKETTVSLRLKIDDEEIHVVRSGPPLRLWINGQTFEQAALDHLLGMSRTRFLNSVIFGQAQPLFIDLSMPDRGELLDDVMTLKRYMDAAALATAKATTTGQQLTAARMDAATLEGRIQGLAESAALQEQEEVWEVEREKRVEAVVLQYEALEGERAGFSEELEKVPANEDPRPFIQAADKLQQAYLEKGQQVTETETNLQIIDEQLDFFNSNDKCPVCLQNISPELAHQHITEMGKTARRLRGALEGFKKELEKFRQNQIVANSAWRTAQEHNAANDRSRALLKSQMAGLTRQMASLEQQAERITEEKNPFTKAREELEDQRALLLRELETQKTNIEGIQSVLARYDYWKRGFRAMRLFAMRRILSQLEIETMNAAHSLGLVGWKIKFVTETETRSGTQRSGVQVIIEGPEATHPWQTLSGGEGQRVRLCVALGLAGLIQRWSGVRYDWEVFDEPSAWLSSEGIEDLLTCLQQRAEQYGRSLYVCDHRALAFAGFSEVMNVIKTGTGSTVEWLRGGV